MELATLESVKEFLEKEEGEEEGEEAAGEPSDPLLEKLIKAASLTITSAAKREFLPTKGVERTFAHNGGLALSFTPYDLRSLESIETEVDGTVTALEAADYSLRPRSPRQGVYEWLKFATNPGECEVTIKGDWGFAEVPEDVEHFTKLTVASWLRGDVFAYVPDLEAPTPLLRGMLPRDVSIGLREAYGKLVVG